jgi:uncharacterized membrane protein YGL010W
MSSAILWRLLLYYRVRANINIHKFFFFMVVPRAAHLLGKCSIYLLSYSISPVFVLGIFEIESFELFAWAGFQPQSSWYLLPEYLGL